MNMKKLTITALFLLLTSPLALSAEIGTGEPAPAQTTMAEIGTGTPATQNAEIGTGTPLTDTETGASNAIEMLLFWWNQLLLRL